MIVRRQRLLSLKARVERQIADADALLADLDNYCRENPHDEQCEADDPIWSSQVGRQREDLQAMLDAVKERLRNC